MIAPPETRTFRRLLLNWFDENARDLPWRRTRDPYAIWVSEIMLQQTRVSAVADHYMRFMEKFPALDALADASEDDVLATWSGLGYYRRARMLHRAARFVAKELRGKLPNRAVDLRTLPGIGEYTSAAIASIGFGEPVACVDGNVARVITRVRGWTERNASAMKIRRAAADLLDDDRPGDFNQAMMELGATVCLPRGPLCLHCPVADLCATRGEHPVAARKKMRSQAAAFAFLLRLAEPNGRALGRKAKGGAGHKSRPAEPAVLLEQRPASVSLMPGMWELPQIDAAKVNGGHRLLDVRHAITITNYYVTIYGYDASSEKSLPRTKGVRRWVQLQDLNSLPLTGLTRKVLKRLKALPGYTGPGPVVASEQVTPAFWP
ncbi:MAG TPA: A/G-specific adenine glycosylase [Silvibacterium sp.]|nr:A/G-specific adenine glycosylase [Silvibacterium sp.]